MKKKILVVEDDKTFRKSLVRTLELEGFEVDEAYDGENAKEVLDKNSFDLIVSDIRMPRLHGIELLHHVKRGPQVPVVLMSGFSEIIDVKEAIEIGAQNFIPKPFSNDHFLEVVNSVFEFETLDNTKEEEGTNASRRFCKIDIENFVNGNQFECPIFLKINDSRFVKIAHVGEDIRQEQVARFIDNGIEDLYLNNDDYIKLIAKTNNLKNIIVGNPNVKKEKKIEVTEKALKMISQFGYEKGFDKEIFQYTYDTFEQIVTLLCNGQNSLKALECISKKSSLYSHCLNTSFLSIALCKSNKWHKHDTIFSIGTAAIFHDIGKINFSEELLFRPYGEMNNEERELYETHSLRGVEILRDFKIDNEVITQVVSQHHEHCDGSGFPLGIAKSKIFPPARVVGLANEFAKYLNGFGGCEKIESIKNILLQLQAQKGKFDEEQLEHLNKLSQFIQ